MRKWIDEVILGAVKSCQLTENRTEVLLRLWGIITSVQENTDHSTLGLKLYPSLMDREPFIECLFAGRCVYSF